MGITVILPSLATSSFSSRSNSFSLSSTTMKVFVVLALVAAASAAPVVYPITSTFSHVNPMVYSAPISHINPTVYSSSSNLGFPNTFYTGASSLPITTYSASIPTVQYSAPTAVVNPVVSAAVIPKTVAQTPGSSHITY